jgi:hypothetical protein
MGKIKVSDIFKSSHLWNRTGQRPLLEIDKDNKIVFVFPDNSEIREAVDEYIQDKTGFRNFSECYRNLRQELYMRKGTKDGNGNTKF